MTITVAPGSFAVSDRYALVLDSAGRLTVDPLAITYSVADSSSFFGTTPILGAASLFGVLPGDTVDPTVGAFYGRAPDPAQSVHPGWPIRPARDGAVEPELRHRSLRKLARNAYGQANDGPPVRPRLPAGSDADQQPCPDRVRRRRLRTGASAFHRGLQRAALAAGSEPVQRSGSRRFGRSRSRWRITSGAART